MNEDNKQIQTLEQTIANVIGKVLVTPYNFSLVALTFILWLYACNFSWSSNWNFDLTKTLHDYIIYFSLAAVVIGTLGQRELSGQNPPWVAYIDISNCVFINLKAVRLYKQIL
jgi:hypothetical protein